MKLNMVRWACKVKDTIYIKVVHDKIDMIFSATATGPVTNIARNNRNPYTMYMLLEIWLLSDISKTFTMFVLYSFGLL